jgi:ABC-2 type transport system permease protein
MVNNGLTTQRPSARRPGPAHKARRPTARATGTSAFRGPVNASVHRVLAIARHQAIVMSRSPHRFFDLFVQPALTLLLYGGISMAVARSTGSSADLGLYLITGAILWNTVHQAQVSVASGAMSELSGRTVLDLMVSPLRMGEYLAGVALFGLVQTLLGNVVGALVAWTAYGFNVLTLGPRLILIVTLLVVTGWAIALLVIATVLRFSLGAEILVWAMMAALVPLSGAFYPVQNLPAFLHPVADVLPFQYIFALARDPAEGHAWESDLLWALTGTCVMSALAVGVLTLMTKVFLRRGYVTRHI